MPACSALPYIACRLIPYSLISQQANQAHGHIRSALDQLRLHYPVIGAGDGSSTTDRKCIACNKGYEIKGNPIFKCSQSGCDRLYHIKCLQPNQLLENYQDYKKEMLCWECHTFSQCLDIIENAMGENDMISDPRLCENGFIGERKFES